MVGPVAGEARDHLLEAGIPATAVSVTGPHRPSRWPILDRARVPRHHPARMRPSPSRPCSRRSCGRPTGGPAWSSAPSSWPAWTRPAGGACTLVTAPAGWGKTTLVGDWLAERAPDGAAWVALDLADNDPARFWRYVAEALRRAGAPVDEQAVGALAGAGETAEAGLSSLLNALADAPRTALLALDDYHLIADDEIHEAVAFLRRTPAGRAPRRHDQPHRPAHRPRAAAGPRRPGRAARSGPALRDGRGRGAAGRGGPATSTATPSPACARAPRAGPPASTWPGCRCAAARTRRASSPTSPATTAWWSTTSPTRCSRACRPSGAASCCARRCSSRLCGPLCDAVAGTRRLGPGARRARALEPVPRAARQPARVVPLPPPLRRAAAARAQPDRARGDPAAPPPGGGLASGRGLDRRRGAPRGGGGRPRPAPPT